MHKKKIKNFDEYTLKAQKGAELFNNKKYDEALSFFQQLAEYNTGNFKVFETMALIYLKLNDFVKADEALRKAMSLFSDKSEVKISMKSFEQVLAELEPIESIEAAYNEQLSAEQFQEKNGKPDSIHRLPVMLGMQYMAKGDFKKAEELLLRHKEKFFAGK